MGKFDLDDLLNDLGPDDGEKLPPLLESENGPAPSAPADPLSSTPPEMFKRQDPKEVPRPPDFTGSGLGTELDGSGAVEKADPRRRRPDDTLSEIAGVSSSDGQLEVADDLGRNLIARKIISSEELATAQRMIKQSPGKRMSEVLLSIGADEIGVQESVAALARLNFLRIDPADDTTYDRKALDRLGAEYCDANLVMPIRKEGSRYVVGTVNPDDVFLLDDVKRRLNVPSIKHVLVTASDIRGVLESLRDDEQPNDFDIDDILADVEEDDVELVKAAADDEDISAADSSPVVRYVNHIIQTAMREGASDIHIEPDEKTLAVRFRIDGILFEMMNPPRGMHSALTSRVKIMANLDIAERRLPQDGRIRATVNGRKIDLRVSTLPTPKGEKTVMRILDNRAIMVTLDQLGFGEDTLTIWKNQINQPHGIILVTGPTGSGKTTTLYSSIQQLDLRRLNVSTVEDPVEYNLKGITQVQTHEKIGMTFSAALKALMRQDPDVILVGEIRDKETATIAIQAAMTGHLVLSTLHTNDAPSSVTRLINIGIEPFLVAGAVKSVLAQRLVRRICSGCKEQIAPTPDVVDLLSMHGKSTTHVEHGSGCAKCRETGYTGRAGLYELLMLDDHLCDSIARNPNVTEFRRVCAERGMVSLREDGFDKVERGITTVEEVLRVTESTI